MVTNTEREQPLYICATFREMHKLRPLLPDGAHVVTQGSSLAGHRASCLFVTDGVDINTEWFCHSAKMRLTSRGSPIMRIVVIEDG